jgi:hypothetical protein
MLILAAGTPLSAQVLIQNGNERMIQIDDRSLLQMVFRNNLRSTTIEDARQQSTSALQLQAEAAAEQLALTPEQKAKLVLAGQGDIHRFLADFELFREKIGPRQMSMERWQELNQEIQPLRKRSQDGLHGPGSLFARTLSGILNEQQQAIYKQLQEDRRRRQYLALVQTTVALIDSQMPLTAAQRNRLVELTMTKTEPPPAYGEYYTQFYLVIDKMASIPDADLRPLFDDKEWKIMQTILKRGKFRVINGAF